MMIDARLIPAQEIIETDVCIVGSGPAGVSLARELANQNFRVCLLESGGLEKPDADTQSLSDIEAEGDFVQVESEGRYRQFGGNSSYWSIQIGNGQFGLRHRPFDEVDFEQRDWLPYSGWPFDQSYLVPYYERAHEFFQMSPFAYRAEDWEDAQSPRLPFVGDRVITRMFRFSPSKVVYEQRRDEIDQASNITTYLHATAIELETDDTAQTVTRVKVACLNGNQFWVASRIFILAGGGVNTTHLLLLSNQVQKNGLGNQNDLVGRFFMDHPVVFGGQFFPADPQIFNRTALYDLRQVNGSAVMGALFLSDETIRREQLPNISFNLFPRPKRLGPSKAIASLKALTTLKVFKQGTGKVFQHLGNVVTGLGDMMEAIYDKVTRKPLPLWASFSQGGWSHLQERREEVYTSFEVLSQTEQFPHPDNRIVLSDQLNKLGVPKPKMQTRWRDEEIEGIQRAQKVLAEEIASAGLGRFQIDTENGLPVLVARGTNHHMGTTRMHPDPKQGVVDENCQVHGVSNLFIASCSVLPTGGYANPTLTIVALAIRVADQIKNLMNQPVPVEKVEVEAPALELSTAKSL